MNFSDLYFLLHLLQIKKIGVKVMKYREIRCNKKIIILLQPVTKITELLQELQCCYGITC